MVPHKEPNESHPPPSRPSPSRPSPSSPLIHSLLFKHFLTLFFFLFISYQFQLLLMEDVSLITLNLQLYVLEQAEAEEKYIFSMNKKLLLLQAIRRK